MFIARILLLFITIFSYAQESSQTLESSGKESDQEKTIVNENIEKKQEEQWKNAMSYGISDQRLSIVKKIRADKIKTALPLLEETFTKENNQFVKEEIIYTFIDMEYSANTKFWSDILIKEDNMVILQRVAYAVEQLKIGVGPALYEKMMVLQNDPNAMRFKSSAVQALAELKYIEALPTIKQLAIDSKNHQDLRGAAVLALGVFQDISLIPTLKELLNSSSESRFIRRYAALSIGRTENPEAIAILTPIALNDEEEQSVRVNSITGLGYLKNSPELEKTMESLSRSDNVAIRTESIRSLGKMQSTNLQELLEYKAKNDPEAIVRREAKIALQSLGVDITSIED